MSEKAFNLIKSLKSNNVENMNFAPSPLRKNRKPLMEKKRRARINDSLEALKEILLKNTVAITQGTRPTKLEKADILEMSVRYVRYLEMLHKRNTLPNATTSESCVTSTTSIRNSLKPKSISNIGYFERPLKTAKTKRSFDEADKENIPTSALIRSNRSTFRTSESSAFRVISSSNESTRKNEIHPKNNNDHSDPWRPW